MTKWPAVGEAAHAVGSGGKRRWRLDPWRRGRAAASEHRRHRWCGRRRPVPGMTKGRDRLGSRSSRCPRARTRSNGPRRSRSPAAALRKSENSWTIRKPDYTRARRRRAERTWDMPAGRLSAYGRRHVRMLPATNGRSRQSAQWPSHASHLQLAGAKKAQRFHCGFATRCCSTSGTHTNFEEASRVVQGISNSRHQVVDEHPCRGWQGFEIDCADHEPTARPGIGQGNKGHLVGTLELVHKLACHTATPSPAWARRIAASKLATTAL